MQQNRVRHFSRSINFAFALALLLPGCTFFGGVYRADFEVRTVSHRAIAEEKIKNGDLQGAIEEYNLHIEDRLAVADRPLSENPYFYSVLIGDLYLKLEKPDEAMQAYISAKDHEVQTELVADRIRKVARWLRERKRYDEALEILQNYRRLDPLMFDIDRDAIHKESLS